MIESIAERYGAVIVATLVVGIPLGIIAVAILVRMRLNAAATPRAAWRASISEVAMVLGTLPWLWMILTPTGGAGAVQLLPGADLLDVLRGGDALVQTVGNLLAFAALGFFLPVRFRLGPPREVVGWVALVVASASIVVETLQFVLELGRVSSVDDVLVNVLGAVLATLASLPWWRERARRVENPDPPRSERHRGF